MESQNQGRNSLGSGLHNTTKSVHNVNSTFNCILSSCYAVFIHRYRPSHIQISTMALPSEAVWCVRLLLVLRLRRECSRASFLLTYGAKPIGFIHFAGGGGRPFFCWPPYLPSWEWLCVVNRPHLRGFNHAAWGHRAGRLRRGCHGWHPGRHCWWRWGLALVGALICFLVGCMGCLFRYIISIVPSWLLCFERKTIRKTLVKINKKNYLS